MEYQIHNQKSYNIHTIKTDRLKTTRIEIVFRTSVTKELLAKRSFVSDLLGEGNKYFKNRKEIAIKLEEIYKPNFNTYTTKVGNVINTVFGINFINPEYIDEKTYLSDIIDFLFKMVLKPNVKNNEFDLDNFEIVKRNILLDIESIEESPDKKAITSALCALDKNSPSSFRTLGTKEDILKITPENIYETYLNMINNDVVDIFVIGNTNMANIIKEIKNNYQNHQIRNKKFEYYITNKESKKVMTYSDKSLFMQTWLVALYNLKNLTKIEKEVTFQVLNFILGSGGLSSKLYKYIREENSYCYGVSSMYFKYDNLLCIASSLAKENVNHTIKLINKAIKEMQKGIFSDEDLNDAKSSLRSSLEINQTNNWAILASVQFKYFNDSLTLSEKLMELEKINKNDIITLANKIKPNLIYTLDEAQK